jgi:hypothetical protein
VGYALLILWEYLCTIKTYGTPKIGLDHQIDLLRFEISGSERGRQSRYEAMSSGLVIMFMYSVGAVAKSPFLYYLAAICKLLSYCTYIVSSMQVLYGVSVHSG